MLNTKTGYRIPETDNRWRRGVLLGAVAFSVSGLPSPVSGSWQCPNGAPPPCARAAVARAAVTIDPNRIAILPFRVSAADTLLGEGLAELLASEFTGEGGPRAVDMGTMLRAWRRAGGGLRTPLTQAEALRVAREMGAGLVAVGTVVGLGSRVTVAASVVAVPGGEERGRTESLSGPSDSLEPLVRRLTIGLLAAAGSQAQADRRTRLSESPTAMRAYMEGLASWRRGRSAEAGAAFERAYNEDSLFARAAFMRYLSGAWYELGTSSHRRWAERVWASRALLSPRDQLLVRSYLGRNFPELRTPEQNLADRRAAVAELPESPEAWYLYGDFLYHSGAALDIRDAMPQAIVAFERSLALDSQLTVFTHLVQAGLVARDSALLRRVWPAYERADSAGSHASTGYLVGDRIGDAAIVARARRRPDPTGAGLFYAALWGLSAALTDELRDSALAHAQGTARVGMMEVYFVAAATQGRPGAARAMPVASAEFDRFGVRRWRIFAAIFGEGDSVTAAETVRQYEAATLTGDTALAMRACATGLWRLHTGSAPGTDLDQLRRTGNIECAESIRLLDAVRTRAPDLDRVLAEADSLFRVRITTLLGFENVLLARVWASRGDYRRAAAASRLIVEGQGSPNVARATGARMEGRMSLMAGDTTGAIAAYQKYLDWRRDAEPVMIPQRDSVRAELAKLVRPRT